jgi:hypothetical protein
LLETQVSIAPVPFDTVLGLAVSSTVGAGGGGAGGGGVGGGGVGGLGGVGVGGVGGGTGGDGGGAGGVGAGTVTDTVADCVAEPPDPVQVSAKLVVELSGGVENVPLVGCVPLQPPEAEQPCAFSTVQSNRAL